MSSRCRNGTRRCPPKTGKCHSVNNRTVKNRSPPPAKHPVSFIEFCKIAAELYGVKYSFCRKDGTIRNIYYGAKDKSNIIYPKKLAMIGTPFDESITRHPFNKMAVKSKTGITANVIVR
jgi:hypothetical protein